MTLLLHSYLHYKLTNIFHVTTEQPTKNVICNLSLSYHEAQDALFISHSSVTTFGRIQYLTYTMPT